MTAENVAVDQTSELETIAPSVTATSDTTKIKLASENRMVMSHCFQTHDTADISNSQPRSLRATPLRGPMSGSTAPCGLPVTWERSTESMKYVGLSQFVDSPTIFHAPIPARLVRSLPATSAN